MQTMQHTQTQHVGHVPVSNHQFCLHTMNIHNNTKQRFADGDPVKWPTVAAGSRETRINNVSMVINVTRKYKTHITGPFILTIVFVVHVCLYLLVCFICLLYGFIY